MGRKPKNTPDFQQIETEQGQLYAFGSKKILVQTKVLQVDTTLGTLLENLMKREVDDNLPVHSRSTD